MRNAWVLALLLLAGCTSPPPDGGVEGTVWYGPVCPVQQEPPDPDCEDRPYQTHLVVVEDGAVVAEFDSREDGSFHVTLQPGTYSIRGKQDGSPPTCSSPEFTVEDGTWTEVDVECDSGIR